MLVVAAETEGIREALAALDRVARLDAQKDLRDEFNKLAGEAVTAARGLASTKMEAKAAGTLAVASTATYAALKFGAGFAGAFGAEYGGQKGQHRVVAHFGGYTGWNQFRGWRGSGAGAGYFMWPGIRQATEHGAPDLAEGVARIFEQ